MSDLLNTLRNIQTQDQFNALVRDIIQSIRNDDQLTSLRNRLIGTLIDNDRIWYERVVLVGNILIDPIHVKGGFFIHIYAPYVIESFLTGILHRHGFGPNRQWSFAELDLTEAEIAYIRDCPFYLSHGYNMPANPHIGACVLMAEALYLSEDCEDGTVWPIIKQMPWSQNVKNAWFPDYDPQGDGIKKHNDHLQAAINHYGIRNALNDGGHKWVKTFTIQFGLSKLQWLRLIMTNIPLEPSHEAARILFNSDHNNGRYSPSFVSTWETMRKVLMGRVSSIEAERLLEESSWIRDEWIPDLINAGQTQRTTKSKLSETDMEEDDFETNVFSEAGLVWAGGATFFKWVINQTALDFVCPKDCKQITITGPCGWIGLIARKQNEPGWRRISGLGLKDDLTFQLSADSLRQNEVGVEFSNPNSGFQITTTSRLYQDGDDVTRFGVDGLRHSNAWGRQLPRGEEFSLCVPVGANVMGAQFTESVMNTLGVKLLHFNQGWTGRIQVSIEDEVVWDSENLLAPSKKLPPDLRAFAVYLVIDTINHTSVSGHLEVMGANPEAVSIPSDARGLPDLCARKALSFGGAEGRPLADLWGGTHARFKINAPDGRNHWITKTWVVTPRGVDNTTPLFLGRKIDGAVISLNSPRQVETMRQFQSMKIKIIAKSVVSGAVVLQGGFPIGLIGRAAKNAPKCLGRKIPFHTETFTENADVIAEGHLMDGVVERGIIEMVTNFEQNGSSFAMEITHELEPTRDIQRDGRHHKILILSQTSQDAGSRLRTTVIEGQAISMEGADWSKWKIQVGLESGNVLGVAVCYGDTLLGCWTKGGQGATQDILEAKDLTKEEVLLLADFLRWFHFPFFDEKLKASVYTFLGNHAAAILFRWETVKELNWNGVVVSEGITEPEWNRVVRALVMEVNYFLKKPINYNGLADLVGGNVSDLSEKIYLINVFITQAPACAKELIGIATEISMAPLLSGTVGDDHSAIIIFDKYFEPSIRDKNKADSREWYWKYRNDPDSCRMEFISRLNGHDATRVSSDGALQNNLDPDWSELRREYAKIEISKGSKEPLIELWRNPSYVVNAALSNGLLQTQGKCLKRDPLQQLKYLMAFPSFARLLARKILSPNLTIPEP